MQRDKCKICLKGESTYVPNKSDVMVFNDINLDSTFIKLKFPTCNSFSCKSYVRRGFGEHKRQLCQHKQKEERKNFFLLSSNS